MIHYYPSMAIHNKIDYPVEEIARRIAAGETHQRIADDLAKSVDPRISPKLIGKLCRRLGIKSQRRGPRSGAGHPEWRGGRIVSKGYVYVYEPNHPECLRINEDRKKKANGKYFRKECYVAEHRLVMEKHIGRYLERNEVVHHKNNDTQDNRIENLELFDSNARHLAETLVGQCPKWTPLGLARMRAAKLLTLYPQAHERDFRVLARLLLSIQKELELDVPPSKIEFAHWLEKHGITFEQAYERALLLEQ